jgi:hypothetical protein
VHVDFDGAGERGRGWRVDVGRAPAPVPVVCGRVFVCDGEDGERGVGGGGEDAVGGLRVVFGGVRGEGLDEALAVQGVVSRSVLEWAMGKSTYTVSSCWLSSTKLCTALALPVA